MSTARKGELVGAMSLTPPSGGRVFVEPLEARIAPAGLLARANLPSQSNDPQYLNYSTAPSAGKLGFVSAADVYHLAGAGSDVYALALSGNAAQGADTLLIYNSQTGFNPSTPSLQVTAGNVVAFFQDKNHDGEVQSNELVGLALGKKVSMSVFGSVDGDIVTDLANDGTLSFSNAGKPKFQITSLSIGGNVNGNLIAGGSINNVLIGGTVHNVYAGTAAAAVGATFNFTGKAGVVDGTITDGGVYKDFNAGASITNLTVLALTTGGTIRAGDGGLGAVGGSVVNLLVQGDTDSFNIVAGAGGVGNADTLVGGVGGSVDTVTINGVANSVVNHPINIQGGMGGADSAGKGGVGGAVVGVFTSFQTPDPVSNTGGVVSGTLLSQNLIVHAGDGGSGMKGGAGGSVSGSSFFGSIPDDGQVNADGTPNAEIQIYGGHGGVNDVAGVGKGGNGGQVFNVRAENFDTLADATTSSIVIQGGDAGIGKNGGTVDSITLLGRELFATAGNGGDGYNKGGVGGSVTNINVSTAVDLVTSNSTVLLPSQLTLNAGHGGVGNNGNGGNGGAVDTVQMLDSDLTALAINTGTHGDGGSSATGLGGQGGTVNNVNLNDTNPSGVLAATAIRSGRGGDGALGGGQAGDVTSLTFGGTGFSFSVVAGVGGSGGAGDGGAGGNLTNVSISNIPDISHLSAPVAGFTGVLTAGAGGSGSAAGGAGGTLDTVSVSAGDTVTLQGGNGGAGQSGVSGAGGTVNATGIDSLVGAVSVTAGNGGLTGAVPGNGGSIIGFVATAGLGINMRAGDGNAGGAGGSITSSGTSLNLLTGLPNVGEVTVRAGNGSTGNNLAGAGGDVTTFNGLIGLGHFNSIAAGNGGGSADVRKVGAGGSVSLVTLIGSGIPRTDADAPKTSQQLDIIAGSAGTSNAAKKGAIGGSVSDVTIHTLDANTLVHTIAAGDGSGGSKTSGAGGSITTIHVGTAGDLADIGVRSGVVFGAASNQSGGLFAGLGGVGATTQGANGSVVDITAAAISGIVAGTGAVPRLTTMVDKIYLEGESDLTSLRANADGSFANISTATFVGSVVNPNLPGASTFKQGDGLIATLMQTQNVNFVPEAEVRPNTDGSGTIVLVDLQEPADAPVTISPLPSFLS